MAYGNITTEQIQTFLSVAKTLNMRKSAEDLSVTQSAVSKRISAFETATEIILFTNHKNNLKLTPAGKFLYTELKKEYSAIVHMLNHAQAIQKSYRQVFNIGTNASFDSNIMLEVVNRFREIYPGLEINVLIDNSDYLVERLVSDEMNVITQPVVNVSDFPEITYEVFTKMGFCIIASKDNSAFKDDGSCDMESLLSETMYLAEEVLQNSRIHKKNLYDLAERNKSRIVEVPNKESAFYQLMMNKGITILSGNNISQNFDLDRMKAVAIPIHDIQYEYGLCYKTEPESKVKDFSRLFFEVLSENANQEIIDHIYGRYTM